MAKVKLPILLLMLSLLVASGHAAIISIIQTEHVPIVAIAGTQHSGDDKSSYISASINGHYLNIVFTENLGEVTIKIFNEAGVALDLFMMGTPTGYQFYIPLAGRYTLVLDFADGDEYYGEFEVND